MIDPIPTEKIVQRNVAILILHQLRFKQWTKNMIIFAAPIFTISQLNFTQLTNSLLSFFLFCFMSGCVYILNDFVDREADRAHPEKRHRPMASGDLNPYFTLGFGVTLLLGSLSVAFKINPLLCLILVIYFVLNVGYSLKLKHVVVIDIMIIAAGFVLRAAAGGVAISVQLTPWFLLCTLLLALFLAISKRRQELHNLGNKSATRKVLQNYSIDLLNQLNTIVTTATIMTYALFTFTSTHTIQMMWTIPLVIYGIFRYLYLIHIEEFGERPEKVLLADKHILLTVLFYSATVIIILIYFE